MKTVAPISLPGPGTAGLDLRDDAAQAPSSAARRLDNLEILPGPQPRIRPRGRLRRWGAYRPQVAAVAGAAGALTGNYLWMWRHDDGAGLITYGTPMFAALTLASQKGDVSGWLTTSGTVTIWRTTAGGSTYKLVTNSHPATSATYTDNTADGSLGATYADPTPIMGAIDDGLADQSHLVHFMALGSNVSESARLLNIWSDGGFYYNSPDSVVPESLYRTGAGGGTAQPYDFALLGDLIWIARHSTSLAYSTGTAAIASLAQPSTPGCSVSTNAGVGVTLATGWQYVVVAVHKKTGVRSLPSPVQSVAAGTYLSVSVTPSGISSYSTHEAEIYRTSDGGQFFQYLTTRTSAGAYTDTTPDSDLSTKTLTYDVGVPDSGFKYIEAHKGLLFAWNMLANTGVDAAPNLLIWSGPDPYNFPSDPFEAVNYRRQIDEDDGDEGSGLKSWGEVLVCFKKRRLYTLTGDPPTGFRWAAVPGSRGLGCIAHRTIQETPIGLIYLSPRGVCLLPSAGEPPRILSQALRELLIEPERDAALDTTSTTAPSTERPAIEFDVTNLTAVDVTAPIRVQLDTDAAFGSPDFDYQTDTAAEAPYFTVDGETPAAAGVTIPALHRVRVRLVPPSPTAGSTYSVRYSLDNGTSWSTLENTFTPPAADALADRVNWEEITWAFAVHYSARSQYWLFLPTGSRKWCDRAYVLDYGGLLDPFGQGAAPTWSGPYWIPATCGCELPALELDGQSSQDYVLLAHPDGFFYVYPWLHSLADFDTGAVIAAADQRVAVTVSGGTTLTASGTSWPTSDYGLRGASVVLTDAEGQVVTGIVTANTGTTLTVVWIGGRTPANGSGTATLGGMETRLETPWLNLAGARDEVAIVRELTLHSGTPAAAVAVQVEASKASRQLTDERLPRRTRTMTIGGGNAIARWADVNLSGQLHRLKIVSATRRADFEITQVDIAAEPTGSAT